MSHPPSTNNVHISTGSHPSGLAPVFVPVGVGVVIPKTPQELMKMIQAQNKRDNKKKNGHKKDNINQSTTSSNKQGI